MSPQRARVIEAMANVLEPRMFFECDRCDRKWTPCETPGRCARDFCERLLDVIEREGGHQ